MFQQTPLRLACTQRGFRPLALGDVGQREAHHGLPTISCQTQRIDLYIHAITIGAQDAQLAGQFSLVLPRGHEVPIPEIIVFESKKLGETAAAQIAALISQHRGTGEVYFSYQRFVDEGEITDRREIIEVDIAISRFFQQISGLQQLLVLGFQINLARLKFSPLLFCRRDQGIRAGPILPLFHVIFSTVRGADFRTTRQVATILPPRSAPHQINREEQIRRSCSSRCPVREVTTAG